MNYPAIIETLLPAVFAAARTLVAMQPGISASYKADGSPVTPADFAAQALLLPALAAATPQVAVVSEESPMPASMLTGQPYWLVDPIDGTRSYSTGKPTYAISLGLVENGWPTLGIIAHPAEGWVYVGYPGAAWRISQHGEQQTLPIHHTATHKSVISSHQSAAADSRLLASHGVDTQTITAAPLASALKFCYVSSGMADYYPRTTQASHWDVAGGFALVAAAGGTILGDNVALFASPTTAGPCQPFVAVRPAL